MRLFIVLLLPMLICGCGILTSPVPANRIHIVTPQGSYDINTPKNVTISQFNASIDTNGVLHITFDRWNATNDPLVIDKAAAGQVAVINAYNGLISSAVSAAVSSAIKGP